MFDRTVTKQACDRALHGIAAGNTDAVEAIYRHMAKPILFLARSVCGNAADAEDILQETICEILKCASSYNSRGNAPAWILAIARNRALMLVRSRQQTVPLDESMSAASAAGTVPPEEYAALHDAMERLDPDERQIITMKVQLGLRHKEIAAVMNISTDASEKRYRRAVAKLNACFVRRIP